jgi:hypothetical protein
VCTRLRLYDLVLHLPENFSMKFLLGISAFYQAV